MTSLLVAAAQSTQAYVIFDDFNVSNGHFNSNIYNASGQDNNIATTSTATRVTINNPIEGSGQQQLQINFTAAGATTRIRHLSGSGTPANNTAFTTSAGVDGWIGFFAKADPTNDPNWTVALYIEGGTPATNNQGIVKSLICDGQWHVYEWNLDDTSGGPDGWGNVTGILNGSATVPNGSHTIDSIIFRNAAAPATVGNTIYIDFVAKSDNGTISNLLANPCLGTSGVSVNGPISTDVNQVLVTGASASANKLTVYQNNVAIGNKTTGITAGDNLVTVSGLTKGATVNATQTIGAQESCVPTTGIIVGGGANPRIRLAPDIRQPGSNVGPVGADGGGSSVNLYWIHATGTPAIGGIVANPSTNWQTLVFYPTDSKFVWNGALTFNADGTDPNQYGTLEGFALAMDDLTDTGPFKLYFDNIRNGSIVIQNFEDETNGAGVLFNTPSFSGTTSGGLLPAPDVGAVSTNYANGGTNSFLAQFQFNSLSSAKYVRLNTGKTGGNHSTPNPEVDLTQPILVDVLVLPPGLTNAHSLGVANYATAFHQTNCLGGNATFGVTVEPPANTSPSYTYTWKKNNVTIAGATSSTFSTNNVTAAAAGTYSVLISDGTASTTLNFLLTVAPTVNIDSQPADPGAAIAVGSSWAFAVGASIPSDCPCANNPALTYQWMLNGANIPGATDATYSLNSAQLSDAGNYSVLVSNTCNGGTATTTNIQLAVFDPNITVATACGSGLLGLYWTNQTSANAFTGPPTWTNTDGTINFSWVAGGPFSSPFDSSTNNFVIRWFGKVQAPYDGQTYTFYTRSDDGVRLWVNGQLLVDRWIAQSATEASGSIVLTTNSPVDVVLEYFEQTGDATVMLSWSSPSIYKGIIAQQQLCAALDTDPVPPLTTLTSPLNNATVTLGSSVALNAGVNPETSTVNKVEFYANATNLVATTLAAPYTNNWTPAVAGVYNITARTYYNGVSTLNTPINKITVSAAVLAPTSSKIASGPGSNYTISYSGGQAVNYVLLSAPTVDVPMSSWTSIATNSGAFSVSNFVVTPSGSAKFYRVSSRSY